MPYQSGLVIVFDAAAILSVIAAIAWFSRGKKYVHVKDSSQPAHSVTESQTR
ncbi:hypothetical protein SAMN05216554_3837 [Herbiconiux ginsengi]|uniref:Uncharacterized protein n=1 Tax=Herbiconiux ginsengi TaxID=381665 RepID=A0A1H3T1G1_9MICO|nr:hypothetical protein SAMN05216554_3837 [Herbiconiux ginsengi]